MENKKILFYGNFGKDGQPVLNGQKAKTISFFSLCKKRFPDCTIESFNTSGFKKKIFINYFRLVKLIKNSNIIIIFPGGINNLKFITKMIRKNKNITVFYPVVGGWLADRIIGNKKLISELKKFACIYPETNGLKNKLSKIGITNTKVLPIFTLKSSDTFENIIKQYELNKTKTIKFVYYGRISEQKGIYKAINAINDLNKKYGLECSIDFYGGLQTEENLELFFSLLSDKVKYNGYLSDNLMPLSIYDYCLFPTFYKGEGFPTTCIESFMCGLPIIASRWAYNEEIIKNNFNGFLFDLNEDLADKLVSIIKANNLMVLKKNAFETSKLYSPNIVSEILFLDIEKSFRNL